MIVNVTLKLLKQLSFRNARVEPTLVVASYDVGSLLDIGSYECKWLYVQ